MPDCGRIDDVTQPMLVLFDDVSDFWIVFFGFYTSAIQATISKERQADIQAYYIVESSLFPVYFKRLRFGESRTNLSIIGQYVSVLFPPVSYRILGEAEILKLRDTREGTHLLLLPSLRPLHRKINRRRRSGTSGCSPNKSRRALCHRGVRNRSAGKPQTPRPQRRSIPLLI